MKRKCLSLLLCFPLLSFGLPQKISASQGNGGGHISFEGGYGSEIRDPEKPSVVIEAGRHPSTSNGLRLDFVPKLDFWHQPIIEEDLTVNANAQLFHNPQVGARANFVQVSDYRGTAQGWQLQLRQEHQFKNETGELTGAVISFDKSWSSSTRSAEEGPILSKDIITIDHLGETYNLAEAKTGTGEGIWAINFGATSQNAEHQENTLSPRLDENHSPYLAEEFAQQKIYQNSGVTLTIPGKTKKEAKPYQTVLTWILSELP